MKHIHKVSVLRILRPEVFYFRPVLNPVSRQVQNDDVKTAYNYKMLYKC